MAMILYYNQDVSTMLNKMRFILFDGDFVK